MHLKTCGKFVFCYFTERWRGSPLKSSTHTQKESPKNRYPCAVLFRGLSHVKVCMFWFRISDTQNLHAKAKVDITLWAGQSMTQISAPYEFNRWNHCHYLYCPPIPLFVCKKPQYFPCFQGCHKNKYINCEVPISLTDAGQWLLQEILYHPAKSFLMECGPS